MKIATTKGINNNSIKEMMRKTDVRKSMNKCVKKKCSCNHALIGVEARNAFGSKRIIALKIVYVHRFNHCSVIEALINNNRKSNEYPHCSAV